MGIEHIMGVGRGALELAFTLAGPVLLAGLIAGVAGRLFQSITPTNEMTIVFIPKMLAISGALLFFGPWMLTQLISFTANTFHSLGNFMW